jgi:hypothetical protein
MGMAAGARLVFITSNAGLRQVKDSIANAAASAEAFDIAPVLERYKAEQAVDEAGARRRWRELVRFLLMVGHAGERGYGMHGPVDGLWHDFVLHTALYQTFCERYAGRFLHHHPGTSQPGAAWRAGYLRFLVDYRTVFGEAPPDDLWPLPTVSALKLPHSAAQLRQSHVKAMATLEHGLRHRPGGKTYSQEGRAGGTAGCGSSGAGRGGCSGGADDGGGCGGGCSGR